MQNADSQHAATPAPGAAPAIYLEPSVSTTTVVTTTTTVTTYAPIPLPALPLPPPEPTDPKEYPLYNVQLPQSMREFGLVFPGGKRAVFREERSETAEAETVGEEGTSGKGWLMMPKDESWSSSSSSSLVPVVGLTEALEGFNTNTTRKRERGSNGSSMDSGNVDTSPARKKARAPPSPRYRPRGGPRRLPARVPHPPLKCS
ncbi:hypothetical protein BT96DRAFT_659687 [Gymnopus androsaceus JB14]|uniref:Uncharacterized protein n=1 Tax=Gymnopus androsaceus JB14 TaxID=1447944 RepID=A0A6A4GFW6_9AGAR|nr:hypothetical protein BT96DRAFT_659687 [Gymnopus androsaceus JB14]